MTVFYPFRDLLPSIRYVGSRDFKPGETYQNVHIGMEVAYVESGSGHFEQGTVARFAVSEGDVFSIKPGKPFSVSADRKTPLKLHYIGLTIPVDRKKKHSKPTAEEEALLPLMQMVFEWKDKISGINQTGDVGRLMQAVNNAVVSSVYPESLVLAKGYCLQWIALLTTLIRDREMQANTDSGRTHKAVRAAIQLIEKSYGQKLTVSQLADAAHLSVYHFARLFKKYTGHSPMQYVSLYRLDKAKALLQNDDMTFAAIAESVGLNDAYYFSAVFKKHEGISPRAYKQQLQDMHLRHR